MYRCVSGGITHSRTLDEIAPFSLNAKLSESEFSKMASSLVVNRSTGFNPLILQTIYNNYRFRTTISDQ